MTEQTITIWKSDAFFWYLNNWHSFERLLAVSSQLEVLMYVPLTGNIKT